ncbi:MAG: hypothetical protein ACOYT4_04670 [Nanoarchaeota archaeon]
MALKRKFVDVEIPMINEMQTVLGPAELLKGHTIKLDLTRKLKGKSLEVVFQILSKENKLAAFPKRMNLMKFYIRRMIRKSTSYVEDSFNAKCTDINVSIKPFLITRKKVSRAVRNNLRSTAKEFLINYTKERNYLQLCDEIYTGELQKNMLPKLKKVYPLSFCEIRVLETKELEKAELRFSPIKKETRKVEEEEEIEAEIVEEEKEEEIKEEKPVKTKKKEKSVEKPKKEKTIPKKSKK